MQVMVLSDVGRWALAAIGDLSAQIRSRVMRLRNTSVRPRPHLVMRRCHGA
jgi:hypothetical protein